MKKLIPYLLILLTPVLIAAAPVKAEAATVNGSRGLAGISKALEDYYSQQNPEDPGIMTFLLQKAEESNYQNEILCRIVEAEATGGTIEQKMNVASCILARVSSPDWPNTIEDVVFQKKQFSPISDGRYYTVTITEETREAVRIVRQEGWTHDCVWFCTPTCKSAISGFHSRLKFAFHDGMHNYYH